MPLNHSRHYSISFFSLYPRNMNLKRHKTRIFDLLAKSLFTKNGIVSHLCVIKIINNELLASLHCPVSIIINHKQSFINYTSLIHGIWITNITEYRTLFIHLSLKLFSHHPFLFWFFCLRFPRIINNLSITHLLSIRHELQTSQNTYF